MAAIDILRDIFAKRKRPDESISRQDQGGIPASAPTPEPVQTLGGTEEVPLMATRPRVVPDSPIVEATPPEPVYPYTGPRTADDDAMRMTQSPMAVKPGQATAPDYSDPRQRAKYIEDKDYSRIVDPETGKVHIGKDRDKKWSLGDKIGSFLLGMFDGTGAIPAAMDRNYMEKRQDKRDLAEAYGSIQRQQAVEKGDLANQQQAAQNEYLAVRPQIEQQKVENQLENINVRKAYYDGLLADKAKGRELSERQIQDLDEYRKELIRQGDERSINEARRIEETIRNNKTNNSLRERQVVTQEARARIAAQKAATGGPARQTAGRTPKTMDPRRFEKHWKPFAEALDAKFNNGEIDETQYNNMVRLMIAKIEAESR